jgi:hypothetical protein
MIDLEVTGLEIMRVRRQAAAQSSIAKLRLFISVSLAMVQL